jgi:EAL and modified HD-GYP domain-containing signal transduction protein
MQVYVARQPVFNKKKKIFGYELLFRGGMANAFPDIDGDTATSKLLSNSFLSFGIEGITGGKKALINFTQELLIERLPTMFPPESVVVEVLEDVAPTSEVIAACQEISGGGYQLALDDFLYTPELEPLIALAGIIKIDFRSTAIEEIEGYVDKLSSYPVKFLAEKVESHEEFSQATEMGFEYFQGYFFSKPEVLKSKDISTSKISVLQIMTEANKEDFNLEQLEKLINRDVAVSYKLLRYMNSAYFKRLNEISSIGQAIVLLGEKGIRRFVSLIVMAKLVDKKPDELLRASIIRARLCELLGGGCDCGLDPSELFTVGLFSLIDAILDDKMEALMQKLPLSPNIKGALVERNGHLADYLSLAASYEIGNWSGVSQAAARIGINENKIPEYYVDAVRWADSLANIQ